MEQSYIDFRRSLDHLAFREGPQHLHPKYPFVTRPARLLYKINMHGMLKNIMKMRTIIEN